MEIDGSCLCEAVTWRANIDPQRVGICHCTQCQTNGASAFQWMVQVPAQDFELLTGELKAYVKTAESGNERALSFCPICATTIHGSNATDADMYSLRLGGCRQRAELKPKFQVWHRSAIPWACDLPAGSPIDTQHPVAR